MMRSSTASCAIVSAVDWVIEESNEATLDATLTVGYGGNVQTRADAETGPELEVGGRAEAPVFEAQSASPGPDPTVSTIVGVVPSDRPATGAGLWVATSAATGRTPVKTRAAASATGTRQARRPVPRDA